MNGRLRLFCCIAGIYRAPRDGTFWLRDLWSAMEDYEQRLLRFYGVEEHGTSHRYIDDIIVSADTIYPVWGS